MKLEYSQIRSLYDNECTATKVRLGLISDYMVAGQSINHWLMRFLLRPSKKSSFSAALKWMFEEENKEKEEKRKKKKSILLNCRQLKCTMQMTIIDAAAVSLRMAGVPLCFDVSAHDVDVGH